jgi:uracil-DNA glycosylase family 4
MLAENLSQTLPAMEVASSTGHEDVTSLEQFNTKICGCMKCALGATRTNFVFGSGNANADIMVIGEAPGADEDEQGLPFVGRAGQLLTKILESVELGRDDVYICNILKCRPPNNRKPLASETDQCEPYLWKQIELIKPKFILALGLTAANTLLKNKESMTQLRGRIHDYQGIRTIVTYHPAALLRNPDWKKHTWEDVKFLRKLYQETL